MDQHLKKTFFLTGCASPNTDLALEPSQLCCGNELCWLSCPDGFGENAALIIKQSLSGGCPTTDVCYHTDINGEQNKKYKNCNNNNNNNNMEYNWPSSECIVSMSVTNNERSNNYVRMKRIIVVKIEMLKNTNRYQLLKTKQKKTTCICKSISLPFKPCRNLPNHSV